MATSIAAATGTARWRLAVEAADPPTRRPASRLLPKSCAASAADAPALPMRGMTAAAAVLEAASDDEIDDEPTAVPVGLYCLRRALRRSRRNRRASPRARGARRADGGRRARPELEAAKGSAGTAAAGAAAGSGGGDGGGGAVAALDGAPRLCATVRLEDEAPPRLSKWVRTSAELAKTLPSKTTFAEALKADAS